MYNSASQTVPGQGNVNRRHIQIERGDTDIDDNMSKRHALQLFEKRDILEILQKSENSVRKRRSQGVRNAMTSAKENQPGKRLAMSISTLTPLFRVAKA